MSTTSMTLAQRTQLRRRAEREAAATAPATSMAGATGYELQLAKLLQDRLRLKQVQSNQGKAELKRQLLPEYVPYVAGVLTAGNGAQDEVLTTVMVWRLDAGDYSGALDIAAYVLHHNMVMPDRFARTTGCLIAEEVATAALNAYKASEAFDMAVLERTLKITAEQDMPDQARAKLYLAMGKGLSVQVTDEGAEGNLVQLAEAKQFLSHAIALHSNCGGKKDLERVERLLKKHAEPATPPAS